MKERKRKKIKEFIYLKCWKHWSVPLITELITYLGTTVFLL